MTFIFCPYIIKSSMDGNNKDEGDIIIPKKSNKIPVVVEEEKRELKPHPIKKASPVVPIIIISVLVLAIIGLIIFLILGNNNGNNPEDFAPDETSEGTSAEVEVLYSTPDDSEDPVGDFTNYLKEEEAKAETEEEKYDAIFRQISFNIAIEEYDKAKEILDSIDESTLGKEDLYRYLNSYAVYYEAIGENALFDEYTMKATEARNRLINEGDEPEESVEEEETVGEEEDVDDDGAE